MIQAKTRRRDLFALAAGWAMGRSAPWPGGTFLQFWKSHLEWDSAQWGRLFGYLAELRVREIVIQWTRYDGIDYTSLTLRVLELARAAGMDVWVGLAHDSSWWGALDTEAPGALLGAVAERHLALARALEPEIRKSRAFRGWYLPEEIDDVHWVGAEAGAVLRSHIRRLHKRLRPLALSGFSNCRLPPAELGALWKKLAGGGLDRVLFQDGIGAGKMSEEAWPGYLRPLSRSLGRRLTVVVEIFEAEAGAAGFRARPASAERIRRQRRVAEMYTKNAPVVFSLPEYATPLGGEAARRLYDEWRYGAGPRVK